MWNLGMPVSAETLVGPCDAAGLQLPVRPRDWLHPAARDAAGDGGAGKRRRLRRGTELGRSRPRQPLSGSGARVIGFIDVEILLAGPLLGDLAKSEATTARATALLAAIAAEA